MSSSSTLVFTASHKTLKTNFSLIFLTIIVMMMVYFAVINGLFNIEGIYKLYPYVIVTAFLIMGLLRYLIGKRKKNLLSDHDIIYIVTITAAWVFLYHYIILGEQALDIFASLRFYFGLFVFFYGFSEFLNLIEAKPENVRHWIISLSGIILISSFCLAAVEYFSLSLGLASPDSFWWIDKNTKERIAMFQIMGQFQSIRSFGLAANSPVLGAFSLFLSTYYYSLVRNRLKLKNIIVLACGIVTVFLSKSGTGFILLALTVIVFILKGSIAIGRRQNVIAAIISIILVTIVILMQTGVLGEGGRLNKLYLSQYYEIFSRTMDFLMMHIFNRWGNVVLGAMNIYQFTKPEGADISLLLPVGISSYFVSLYDYAIIGFFIEFGILGIIAYLYSLFRLIKIAFPKEAFIARWSLWVLLLGTLHYPVIFWMCSQVMGGLILAVNIYTQNCNHSIAERNRLQEQNLWGIFPGAKKAPKPFLDCGGPGCRIIPGQ